MLIKSYFLISLYQAMIVNTKAYQATVFKWEYWSAGRSTYKAHSLVIKSNDQSGPIIISDLYDFANFTHWQHTDILRNSFCEWIFKGLLWKCQPVNIFMPNDWKQESELNIYAETGVGARAGVNFFGAGVKSKSKNSDSDHLWSTGRHLLALSSVQKCPSPEM